MALLFLDNSNGSKKVITSRLYKNVKARITVVEPGTLSDEYSASSYNIMAFPTIIEGGKKYIGVDAVFRYMKELDKHQHRKPLF